VLITLLTVFLWSGLTYPFHHRTKICLLISATITALIGIRPDWLSGFSGYNQVDTIGNLQSLFTLDSLLKTHTFSEFLGAWNPYTAGGLPLLPKFHTLYFFLYFVNRIDPFPLSLIGVHNLLSVNYAIIFAIGLLLLAKRLTGSWLAAFFPFVSVLYGTLTQVTEWQEMPRWIFAQPYILLSFLIWVETGRPLAFASGLSLLGLLATMYLPNGTLILLGCLALVAALKNKTRASELLRGLVTPRKNLGITAGGIFAFLLILSPMLYYVVTTQTYSDSGRHFTKAYVENNEPIEEAALKGHLAEKQDLLRLALDRHLSYANLVWRFGGPFAMWLALCGLIAGFYRRETIPLGLGLGIIVLGYFSLGNAPPLAFFWQRIPLLSLFRHKIFFLGDLSFAAALLSAYGIAELEKRKTVFLWCSVLLFLSVTAHLLPDFASPYSSLYRIFFAIAATSLILMVFWARREKALFFLAMFTIFGTTAFCLLRDHIGFVNQVAELWRNLPRKPYAIARYPETRPCVANSPYTNDMENKTACLTKWTPLLSGLVESRLTDLINLAYPERTQRENILSMLTNRVFTREYRLFGNAGMPLFFFTDGVEKKNGPPVREDLMELLRHYQDEKPRAFFFGSDQSPLLSPRATQNFFRVPVDQDYSKLTRIGLDIDAPTDGFLVRLENFHPSWQATLDGKPTPIFRANYAFQAIPIARGRHRIHFEFQSLYALTFWLHQLAIFLLLGVPIAWGFKVSSSSKERTVPLVPQSIQ
jgi:hypothetical protein